MTSTFEEMTGKAEVDLRREAISHIKPLYDLRKLKADYDKGIKAFDPSAGDYGKMGALRRWLLDNPDQPLVDGETHLEAILEGAGTAWLCKPIEEWESLWGLLREVGALVVDPVKLKEVVGYGDIPWELVKDKVTEVERTPRLKIRESKG